MGQMTNSKRKIIKNYPKFFWEVPFLTFYRVLFQFFLRKLILNFSIFPLSSNFPWPALFFIILLDCFSFDFILLQTELIVFLYYQVISALLESQLDSYFSNFFLFVNLISHVNFPVISSKSLV